MAQAKTKAVETKVAEPAREKRPETVREFLESEVATAALAKVSPDGYDPRKAVAMLLASASGSDAQMAKLMQCTKQSLLLALAACVDTGLEPNGPRQEAIIIPYGTTAQFQPMYRGLAKLIRRAGHITKITTGVVHIEDTMHYRPGIAPEFWVEPCGKSPRNLDEIHASYAIFHYNTPGLPPEVEVAFQSDLVMAKKLADSRKPSPAWKAWPGEMSRKFALKRGQKYLPGDDDRVARAIMYDNLAHQGKNLDADVFDVEPLRELAGETEDTNPDYDVFTKDLPFDPETDEPITQE